MARVHLLAGLNGAGKSTLARRIVEESGAVRLSLDAVMRRMHPELRFDDARYGVLAERCRLLLWDLALEHLQRHVDVVLDWNCWSAERRRQWRDAALDAGHEPVLHHVDADLTIALERLRSRAAAGDPESHGIDVEELRRFSAIFEPPGDDATEGMAVHVVRG
ncbi:hypothetical protein L332_01015 [Agrococcus pavilionensis RW1]|uniref:Zeta toxin domain-containing protein n=1 Tax=Agrococcus pavilionensis RW1 TaxID=1330458 RepID=U1MMC7_9MICO|nr:ATP-binding protein [Agrococcus pavilionensis]ERG63041.1 hypothetical protein L332_01015 [Agrococcus pavilionensis RW1]